MEYIEYFLENPRKFLADMRNIENFHYYSQMYPQDRMDKKSHHQQLYIFQHHNLYRLVNLYYLRRVRGYMDNNPITLRHWNRILDRIEDIELVER